ncbi:major tail protein [Shouchella lehensis]|uniref:Phage major tail protein n=1 Tax=Shouchella lehensis G1 TaxID=1246626 RepID=A0A060M093_9BACI|nr:major tail protein [Shouchella lehensis]AIC95440.1 Phage major tail protein [Shouchella lehensis G1]
MKQGASSYIGARDLVGAELLTDNEDGVTYGEIIKIAPLKGVSITQNSNNSPDYADDGVNEVISSDGAINLSLSTAGIADSVKAKLLGLEYDKGATRYHKDRISPYFAIGFKSRKADGSDGYVWLFKGRFALPNREHNTKEDTATPQGTTLEAVFIERKFDGEPMHTLDTAVADEEVVADYFKKVFGASETETP